MTEKKEIKTLDEEDFRDTINKIVDEFTTQKASQEMVTEHIKRLSDTYGLDKTLLRKVARSIYKFNTDEENEKNEQFNELIDVYNN